MAISGNKINNFVTLSLLIQTGGKKIFTMMKKSFLSTISVEVPSYIIFNKYCKDEHTKSLFLNDMKVMENFITDEEEKSMYDELEPHMKKLRYERSHWDGAIEGYRECERSHWKACNRKIIDRVQELAFSGHSKPLKSVHVLDLKAEGIIKPHIDSIKFCGNTIAGLSLLSHSIMRLRLDKNKEEFIDVLLKRKSLYIMTGSARYNYTHEILGNEESKFGDETIKKSRRISVICRNEP